MSENRRVLRVQKEIRDILSMHLISRYQHEYQVMISIPDVQVSPDLKNARILVSTLGDEEAAPKITEALNEDIRDIQYYLNSRLKMKFSPRIRFFADESFKIRNKLKQISEEQ